MTRKIFITIGLAILSKLAFPQQDLTLYYMDRIPQVNTTNPAFFPESKYNVGIPLISSTYLSLSNSGFVYNDLVDIDKTIKNLGNRNYLGFNTKFDLLSLGIQIEENYFSLNITEHFMARFIYPGDMFRLIWLGNGDSTFIGKRADMDGLGFDFMHYREFALGYSRKLMDDKLSLGLRAKYLSGFQNFWTRRSQLGLHTGDENYAYTLDGGLEINSSGFEQFRSGNYDFSSMIIRAGNHGMALDLGAEYKYSEEITLSASVLDLGFINWKNNVLNIRQNDFNYSFSGFDLGSMTGNANDSVQSSYTAALDSLEQTFKISENSDPYKTWLTSRFMVGGLYQFHDNHAAGALLHGDIIRGRFRPAITLSMNTKVQRWLSASLAYSYYNRSFRNIGAGLSLNAGPVQLYFVSDNILAPFMPYSVKNAHFRFGINLTLGRPPKKYK